MMNYTNIEFTDLTWNPIVGCQIGCSYCWAERFNRWHRFIPDFKRPTFYENRLQDPYTNTKKGQFVFVVDMGDIFSPGVEDKWINRILNVCFDNPKYTYQFLTKNPKRFQDFKFPCGSWLGVSVTRKEDAWRLSYLPSLPCKYTTFVLVEPLLGSMDGVDFSKSDLLFVGAQTGPGSVAPKKEWIDSIQHHAITNKENIKRFL